jgi:hypothetical protein
MDGQWIGDYGGTVSGTVMVNVDDRGSYFEGVAYLRPSGTDVPITGVSFRTVDKARDFAFKTSNIWAIDPRTGHSTSWDSIKDLYPSGFLVSNEAEVAGSWDERHLTLSWRTDIGSSGNCDLPRTRADQPSELNATKMTWADFKQFVDSLGGPRNLFRGQSEPWRLRTAFHRSGRANVIRFLDEDIRALHRHLSVRTRHLFDLSVPDQNGAFFNLVQHHGYPTPLLDWTYSPFVAAFFAYRTVSKERARIAEPNRVVRIFVLDDAWRRDINQVSFAERSFPHFSIAEFIGIENERMVPQQSVSAITNVDDIESYIGKWEKTNNKSYLAAIDLPLHERARVYRDLDYMGVTAGSLFPGLDGACEELRERNF